MATFILPLDSGRRLGGDVVDDAVDAADFAKALSRIRGKEDPNFRHPFNSL